MHVIGSAIFVVLLAFSTSHSEDVDMWFDFQC